MKARAGNPGRAERSDAGLRKDLFEIFRRRALKTPEFLVAALTGVQIAKITLARRAAAQNKITAASSVAAHRTVAAFPGRLHNSRAVVFVYTPRGGGN